MDQTVNYRALLTELLREEAQLQPKHGPIKIVTACDDETGQYLLIAVGWEGKQRVDSVLFHAQLVDGAITIETDNTEEGLKQRLVAAGVSEQDIAFAAQSRPLALERAAA